MDERLNITIQDTGGTLLHISPLRSNTLREVMNEAQLFPVQCNPFCLLRGNKVHMDLSLACLNVKDGETILVVFPKENNKTKLISRNHLLKERKKQIEKIDSDIYKETLRVSDFQYNAFELFSKAPKYYEEMLKHQRAKEEKLQEEDYDFPLVTESAKEISNDPLPVCWNSGILDEMDSSILLNRKSSKRKRKSSKSLY